VSKELTSTQKTNRDEAAFFGGLTAVCLLAGKLVAGRRFPTMVRRTAYVTTAGVGVGFTVGAVAEALQPTDGKGEGIVDVMLVAGLAGYLAAACSYLSHISLYFLTIWKR
jgi:hypothetical protein